VRLGAACRRCPGAGRGCLPCARPRSSSPRHTASTPPMSTQWLRPSGAGTSTCHFGRWNPTSGQRNLRTLSPGDCESGSTKGARRRRRPSSQAVRNGVVIRRPPTTATSPGVSFLSPLLTSPFRRRNPGGEKTCAFGTTRWSSGARIMFASHNHPAVRSVTTHASGTGGRAGLSRIRRVVAGARGAGRACHPASPGACGRKPRHRLPVENADPSSIDDGSA
jgi:hypothetical protein